MAFQYLNTPPAEPPAKSPATSFEARQIRLGGIRSSDVPQSIRVNLAVCCAPAGAAIRTVASTIANSLSFMVLLPLQTANLAYPPALACGGGGLYKRLSSAVWPKGHCLDRPT